MARDSPRPSYRNGDGEPSRYRDGDRRDRRPRNEDDDGYRSGPRRDRDRDRNDYRGDMGGSLRRYDHDDERDRRRRDDRERDGGRARGYDRDDRRRDRDDDRRGDRPDRDRDRQRGDGDRDRRGGPSRRSASPQRPSQPRSREGSAAEDKAEDKAKPNFAPSGLLAADTKTVQHGDGTKTVLKYHEPPEARKPSVGWRLYVFKGKEQVGECAGGISTSVEAWRARGRAWADGLGLPDLLHIQRQSAYLIGRDRAVVDIAVEHPSCSKQHAVIQCTSLSPVRTPLRASLLRWVQTGKCRRRTSPVT